MPRDGSGIYALPTGTIAVSGTKVSSAAYNTFLADMVSTLNGIQPIALGGTGQVSIEGFRTTYSLYSKAETDAKLTGYLPNKDGTDATKVLAFNISGFSTATTRTIIIPNADGTMMLNSQYPTLVSLEGLTLAAGAIPYATAGDTLAALAIGASGKVLSSTGTAPIWVDDSALVKIEAKTASGSSISFTNLASYAEVLLVFESVNYSGLNQPFLRVSKDNGATWEGAASAYVGATGNDETGTSHSTEVFLTDAPTASAISGRLTLLFFNNAAEKTTIDGQVRGDGTVINKVVSRRDAAEANNGILISTSTGTMTSGTVTAWGRKR